MPTSPGILKTPIINNVNTLIGMFKLKYDPIKLNKNKIIIANKNDFNDHFNIFTACVKNFFIYIPPHNYMMKIFIYDIYYIYQTLSY